MLFIRIYFLPRWSDTHLDIVNNGGQFFHFLTGAFVDGIQCFDGLGRFLNMGDTFVEVFVQFLHLLREVGIEIVDAFFKVLVIGKNLVDFVDVMDKGTDGVIRNMNIGLGVFRQLAHFLGHNGEAAACLACTGCLDGGVEGQEVGLGSNLVNELHDVVDFLGALGEHI